MRLSVAANTSVSNRPIWLADAAFVLDARTDDGITGPFIHKKDWKPALINRLDPEGTTTLGDDLETVISKRDLIHQDKLGARADIDWHSIGYDSAFLPAKRLIAAIIVRSRADAPADTNLGPYLKDSWLGSLGLIVELGRRKASGGRDQVQWVRYANVRNAGCDCSNSTW